MAKGFVMMKIYPERLEEDHGGSCNAGHSRHQHTEQLLLGQRVEVGPDHYHNLILKIQTRNDWLNVRSLRFSLEISNLVIHQMQPTL